MAAADLVIKVVADTSRALNDIARVQRQIRGLTAISAGVQVMTSAFQMVRGSIAGLRSIVEDATQAWNVQYTAVQRLAVAVANAGPAFGATRAELERFAARLQSVTNFGDEAIISISAYFTRLGLGANEVKRATALSLDLAAATGRDLPEAAQALGRALQNPLSATRSLTAAGIMLTEEEKKLLSTLRESGDAVRMQAEVFSILESRVGGAAEAMATPTRQIANLWSDLKEELGQSFALIAHAFATMFKPLLEWIIEYMQSLPGHTNIIVQTVRVILNVIDVLGRAIQINVAYALQGIGALLGLLSRVPGLTSLGQLAQDAAALGSQLSRDALSSKLWGEEFVERVDNAGRALDNIKAKAKGFGQGLTEGLTQAQKEIYRILEKLRDELETIGMTEAQRTMLQLERLGATESQLAEARELLKQIEAQKAAQEELNRAREDAKRIIAETRTEEEKMHEQIARAQELLAGGFINVDTYVRYLQRLRATIAPPEKLRGPEFAEAVQQGAGAFSRITAAVTAFREAGAQAAEKTARNTDMMVKQLDALIDAVRDLEEEPEIVI